MMQQLEINFFWPLTEQVPLDLDYSNCENPKLYPNLLINSGIGNISLMNTNSNWATTYHIDVDNVVVKTNKKPNIVQKTLFKIMGIKLENKQ